MAKKLILTLFLVFVILSSSFSGVQPAGAVIKSFTPEIIASNVRNLSDWDSMSKFTCSGNSTSYIFYARDSDAYLMYAYTKDGASWNTQVAYSSSVLMTTISCFGYNGWIYVAFRSGNYFYFMAGQETPQGNISFGSPVQLLQLTTEDVPSAMDILGNQIILLTRVGPFYSTIFYLQKETLSPSYTSASFGSSESPVWTSLEYGVNGNNFVVFVAMTQTIHIPYIRITPEGYTIYNQTYVSPQASGQVRDYVGLFRSGSTVLFFYPSASGLVGMRFNSSGFYSSHGIINSSHVSAQGRGNGWIGEAAFIDNSGNLISAVYFNGSFQNHTIVSAANYLPRQMLKSTGVLPDGTIYFAFIKNNQLQIYKTSNTIIPPPYKLIEKLTLQMNAIVKIIEIIMINIFSGIKIIERLAFVIQSGIKVIESVRFAVSAIPARIIEFIRFSFEVFPAKIIRAIRMEIISIVQETVFKPTLMNAIVSFIVPILFIFSPTLLLYNHLGKISTLLIPLMSILASVSNLIPFGLGVVFSIACILYILKGGIKDD